MRSIILIYFALFASPILYAGDTPCGAPLLSTDSPDFVLFNNLSNSDSGIEAPPYGGYVGPDTWISFVMPNGGFHLIVNGLTMIDPAIAIYSGPCTEPKLLYNVLDNNCDGSQNPLLYIDKLNSGEQYFIRIWAQDASPDGDFEIKMIQNFSGIPDFLAFADATIVGDCIELTQNTGNQQGCAWYQNAIDFNMPFSHEMTANFGTIDANGADGICLVYQSVGQDFCGGTGEGIGASGMPNSAIFEFDTWQNGNLADPVQDHCALNINGNMNHNNSIEGPITLGNIEDGLDHTILFEWNPSGNLYTVYFDGMVVLNGSFDFINNCFGGSNLAFWGYTSATGGSNNLHIICPVVEVYEPSYTEYNEIDICEGESYMGHYESGFYVDFISGSNGCQYQLNTLLTVHAIPEPEYLYEVVCEGEYILVADEVFTLPEVYEINTYTAFGCDSTIYLNLENVVTTVTVEVPQIINCLNSSVQLVPVPGSNFDINSVNYTWSFNQSTTSQEIITTNEAGTYYLTAQIMSNGLQCLANTSVTVEIDTLSPVLEDLPDIFLDCTNIDTDTLLSYISFENGFTSTWTYQDSIIGYGETIGIEGAGSYALILTDTINGCTSMDTFSITMSNDIPQIELDAEALDCQTTTLLPYFSTTGIVDSITWSLNNDFFSYDSLPLISMAGEYTVLVQTPDGCESSETITIEIDTIKPQIFVQDSIVPCGIQSIDVTAVSNPNMMFEWSSPSGYIDTSQTISTTIDGWHYVSVTNPNNHCVNSDSVFIQFKGASPTLTLHDDTLNCYTPTTLLEPSSNQSDLIYNWIHESAQISNEQNLEVLSEGWYILEITNPNGCQSIDSSYIHTNFAFPEVDIYFDTISCSNPEAIIDAEIINGEIITWDGPNNFQHPNLSFNTSSAGTYYLSTINVSSGCTGIDSIEIIDNSVIPVFELETDTINCNDPIVTLPFHLVTPYVNLAWVGPSGFSSNSQNPEVTEGGEYVVHVEFEGGCFLDTSLVIGTDLEPPLFQLEYDSITCFSPQVTILASLFEPNDTYLLTTPDETLVSSTMYTGIDSGSYHVQVIGDNGCIATDTFLVSAYLDEPIFTISDIDSLTCRDPVTNVVISTDLQNYSYSWTGPDNFFAESNSISIDEEGDYSVTVQNDYGCTVELDFHIKSYSENPEVILMGENIYCDQTSSTIQYESPDDLTSIVWQSTNDFIDYEDSIVVEKGGWYSIQVENEYGCQEEASIFIEAYTDPPLITLLTGDTLIVNIDDPEGEFLIDVNSASDYEINWFPAEGLSCNDCLNPLIIGAINPVYEVVVTNEFGCVASKSIHIKYKRNLNVDIPNVFSPGTKDGSNDFFTLYGNEKVDIVNSMIIYDRWGNLVEEKSNFEPNIPNLGWNGYNSRKLCQSGVYVYIFKITTVDGFPLTYYGTVTLL